MRLFNVTEPNKKREPIQNGLDFDVGENGSLIHLLKTEEVAVDLEIDPSLAQHAQLARSAGYNRIGYGEIVRNGTDLRLTEQKDHHSREAIVLLQTECGENGVLRLTSNTFSEYMATERWGRHVHQKVVKSWHPFPPMGVESLNQEHLVIDAEGVCQWSPQYPAKGCPPVLLKMTAGSSFRVWRTGDLGGAPSVFLVSWSGTELWTVVPRNHEHMSRRQGT